MPADAYSDAKLSAGTEEAVYGSSDVFFVEPDRQRQAVGKAMVPLVVAPEHPPHSSGLVDGGEERFESGGVGHDRHQYLDASRQAAAAPYSIESDGAKAAHGRKAR